MFLKEQSNITIDILKNLNESVLYEEDKYIPGNGEVLITPEQAQQFFKGIEDRYGRHNQITIKGAGPDAKYQGEYWEDFIEEFPQFKNAKFNGESYSLNS